MDEKGPITAELRKAVTVVFNELAEGVRPHVCIIDSDVFDNACDVIDAVHRGLEDENRRLKAERDSMAAALDRAQGEDASADHPTVSTCYVDVVPRFDWQLMAAELDEFAVIVRSMSVLGDDPEGSGE